jgi:hypothetical protein
MGLAGVIPPAGARAVGSEFQINPCTSGLLIGLGGGVAIRHNQNSGRF